MFLFLYFLIPVVYTDLVLLVEYNIARNFFYDDSIVMN